MEVNASFFGRDFALAKTETRCWGSTNFVLGCGPVCRSWSGTGALARVRLRARSRGRPGVTATLIPQPP